MTREVTALLLALFLALNFTTFFLFAKSHNRIRARQRGLSHGPMIALSLLGGAFGALLGKSSFSQMRDFPISRLALGAIGLVYAGILLTALFIHLSA